MAARAVACGLCEGGHCPMGDHPQTTPSPNGTALLKHTETATHLLLLDHLLWTDRGMDRGMETGKDGGMDGNLQPPAQPQPLWVPATTLGLAEGLWRGLGKARASAEAVPGMGCRAWLSLTPH